VRLLLADDLVPIAEELCAIMAVPATVVSARPAGDGEAVLRAAARLAEWERLGWTGAESTAVALAREIARA
jgi:hypothetical protein